MVDAIGAAIGHRGRHLLDQTEFDGAAVEPNDTGDAAHAVSDLACLKIFRVRVAFKAAHQG